MSRTDASVVTRPVNKWKRRVVWFTACAVVASLAVFIKSQIGDEPAHAQTQRNQSRTPANAKQSRSAPRQQRVDNNAPVARVNGQAIFRKQLLDATVRRFGEEVLESMVNKQLIRYHCGKRGIQVTQGDIDAEIDRMASWAKLNRQQWFELLQNERGITPDQYARDIVWPTVALRKLAAKQLTVSNEELQKAYEAQYGPAVRARLIVVSNAQLAQQLQQQLAAKPDSFPALATKHSEDINSASIGGLIQPIRRHVGDSSIEQAAFALQPGQVSPVIHVANQHAILRCEGRDPARNVAMDRVKDQLTQMIKEEKLREEANQLFDQLQKTATIKNVFNDPHLSKQMPGVVALVNGDRISYNALGEECLVRHGEEALQVEISQLMLAQALAREKLQITQQDIDSEIAHAAQLSGIVDAQNNPDIAKWMTMATTDRGITQQQYIRDSVWPSAALKKLTANRIEITQEDLQKAFDANYGVKVRCQAIVLGNQRRALEVFDMARKNPTEKAFGDLAAEYSIEPSTKALRGEVPPIRRNGGRDKLENAAFNLTEVGQLSTIVQMGDKFIILRYLGRTEPLDVQLSDPRIRQILHQDLYEKKLRIEMEKRFVQIQEAAKVENLLTSTPSRPSTPPRTAVRDPSVRPAATQRGRQPVRR